MTEALIVCAGCHRHHRSSESACPFCGASVGATLPSARPGALHTAIIAAALALAATQRAEAQLNPTNNPRIGMEHAPAAGYGAPPRVGPFEPLMPQQGPVPTAPALFELSRGPVIGGGRRPSQRWSRALVIYSDGNWVSGDRSGRLRPSPLPSLRPTLAPHPCCYRP